MKSSSFYLMVLILPLFVMQEPVLALNKIQKSLIGSVVAGSAIAFAMYQKNKQAELLDGQDQKSDHDKKQRNIKRSAVFGLFAAAVVGTAGYGLSSDDEVKLEDQKPANQMVPDNNKNKWNVSVQNAKAQFKVEFESWNLLFTEKDSLDFLKNFSSPQSALEDSKGQMRILTEEELGNTTAIARVKAFKQSLQQPYQGRVERYDHTIVQKAVTSDKKYKMDIQVINMDTLNAAKMLLDAGAKTPAVLDMADEYDAGGGPHLGWGTQEEQICYRSNLFRPLYEVSKNKVKGKSFIADQGAIYVSHVMVTRASEAEKFVALEAPYEVAVIASAACDLNWNKGLGPKYAATDEYAEVMKAKIRTQLRVALANGHHAIVLSAYGCGAFYNDPKQVSQFYKDILEEDEFDGAFEAVCFAIYSPQKSSKNLEVFKQQFNVA